MVTVEEVGEAGALVSVEEKGAGAGAALPVEALGSVRPCGGGRALELSSSLSPQTD